MHNRRTRKPPSDPEGLFIQSLIDREKIRLEDPKTFRISKFEAVVERTQYQYQILTIPHQFRNNEDLLLILDYFTSKYHWFENPTRSTRVKSRNAAVLFLRFLSENYENLISLPQAIQRFARYLNKNKDPGAIKQNTLIIKKIFKKAIEEQYPEASRRPKNISDIIYAANSIQVRYEKGKKKEALGRYLGISHKQYTNKQLLHGLRLGSMWLLNKLSGYRKNITSLPAIATALDRLKGLTEAEIEHTVPNDGHKLENGEEIFRNASYEQWSLIQSDSLLTEWQFYNDKSFRRHALDYGKGKATQPYLEATRDLFISRCITHSERRIRNSPKGLGQKDIEWRVFRPVYHAARNAHRPGIIMWGIDWIRHSPIEKLLFVWLLSTERVQSNGIKHMTPASLELDDEASPKTLQLFSLKLRRGGTRSLERAIVKGQIYKRHHPPFHTYLEWRKTCISAIKNIAEFNTESLLIPNSSAALSGCLYTDMKLETFPLLRMLITSGTLWQETFLAENDDHPVEAMAFIEILRNRITPSYSGKILKLPPDPIGESLVLEKELETNFSARNSAVTSSTIGQTVETGRRVYKDGFLSAGVAEIVEPLSAFIRSVGDQRFKDAEALSEQLSSSSRKLSLSEIKQISGIEDSSMTIEKLLELFPDQDRLILTGELLHGDQKIIIETDLTAAVMGSYIRHIESSLPTLLDSERTETCTAVLGELIYLRQTLNAFPENIKRAGEKLCSSLDLNFPPVI